MFGPNFVKVDILQSHTLRHKDYFTMIVREQGQSQTYINRGFLNLLIGSSGLCYSNILSYGSFMVGQFPSDKIVISITNNAALKR